MIGIEYQVRRWVKWYKLHQQGYEPAELLYRCGEHKKYKERHVWRMLYNVEYVGGRMAARVMREIEPHDPQTEITDDYLRMIMSNIIKKPGAVPTYLGIEDEEEAEALVKRCRAIKKTMPAKVMYNSLKYKSGRKVRYTDEEILDYMKMYSGNCPFEFAEQLGYTRRTLRERLSATKLPELYALACKKKLFAPKGHMYKGTQMRRTKKMYQMYLQGYTIPEIAERYGLRETSVYNSIWRSRRRFGG